MGVNVTFMGINMNVEKNFHGKNFERCILYIACHTFPIGVYDFLSYTRWFYSIKFKVYSPFLELSLKSY